MYVRISELLEVLKSNKYGFERFSKVQLIYLVIASQNSILPQKIVQIWVLVRPFQTLKPLNPIILLLIDS